MDTKFKHLTKNIKAKVLSRSEESCDSVNSNTYS